MNIAADAVLPVSLPTPLQSFIHKSRYARWLDSEQRRENWPETVDRYVDFFAKRFPDLYPASRVKAAIQSLRCMPSMRALMTAGPALDKDEMAGYNCSYIAVDNVRAFDEILYVLMCGTGVGFSVERQSISHLPEVAEQFHPSTTVITVKDSKIGWASAFREMISLLYAGQIPQWDVSKVRPAGAKLKTFGGRASGPKPLVDLFKFAIALFKGAAGRKLNSVECHDLVCKIADIVVVGGVRRSALISLSNLSDDRMRVAKSGKWWETEPQRALANNSAAYTERPDMEIFLKEWQSLIESKSGERGIFNRVAAKKKAAESGRRNPDFDFGTNPCGEILLRSAGLCNLTEVVIRAGDTLKDLMEKVEVATIMGTFQSTLSKFRYVRSVWTKNQEEERLLGVSMTGIMDHEVLSKASNETANWLSDLRAHAVKVNAEWAAKLGINQSVAITTVKPSGTISLLAGATPGVHFPIAMEGALKLKEITYIHAEAYAAGELKHGPLALVDSSMPVVVVAPNDALIEKLKSNLQEVRARGGELFVFADQNTHIEETDGVHVINLVDHAGPLSPILHVIPLQLLAYHVALARKTDVDKPRNLAKSVTVE